MSASQPTALTRRLSPVEVFVGEVLPPDREDEVFRSLPAGVDPQRFKHSLSIAVMQNPGLLKVHPGLVFREVSKSASLGLSMDPQLGEAYLVIVKNSKAQRDEPQLRIGYKGLIKLARQSGEIALIYAHAVHEHDIRDDRFRVSLGAHLDLYHQPDVFGDRGPVVGFYAVLKYRDGEIDFEPMPIHEVHKIRDRTDAYRAFKAGRIKSTPWADFEGEMARKTVIRRLLKRAPLSPDLASAIKLMDEEDDGILDDGTERRGPGRPKGSTTRLAQSPPQPPPPPPSPPEPDDDDEGLIDEATIATPEADPPSPDEDVPIDVEDTDYQRGIRDFRAGLKKCVKAEIHDNPARFAHWKAGWDDARDVAEGEVAKPEEMS